MSFFTPFLVKSFGPYYLVDRANRLGLYLTFSMVVFHNTGTARKKWILQERTTGANLIETFDEKEIIKKMDEVEFGTGSNVLDFASHKYSKLYIK